jgi:DNA-binding HxlR family transcriptional regulator
MTPAGAADDTTTADPIQLPDRVRLDGSRRQMLPGLSDKVLTERLKNLQQSGLVARGTSSVSRARRPYVLTARGATLTPILTDLYAWGTKHAASFGVTVDNPLQRLDGSDCGT